MLSVPLFRFQAMEPPRVPGEEMANSFQIIGKAPEAELRSRTGALATYLPLGKA
jgi:hypothetical protein